jgi:hypothetical protein
MKHASFFLRICAELAAAGTAVLFLLPLIPDFPDRNFDASWAYALNEAVARHLIFGRDIVLTFGPLAFIYTAMYHPATDGIMLLGSVILGTGLAVGCALLPYPRKSVHLVILPFLLAEIISRDGIYIFLPVVLLLLVLRVCAPADNEHHLQPSGPICVGIAIVACSVALLPLVKGSFTGTTFFCGGLSFLVLLQRHPSAAAAFAGLSAATAAGAWVATGQPINALPAFFVAQASIISGYSEAMSSDGPPQEVLIYLLASIVLLGVFYQQFARRLGKTGYIAAASFAFALFVCLKAGFVRHDAHALIAAGALLIAAYCVTALTESVFSVTIVWVVVLFAWASIDRAHSPLDISLVLQRIHNAVSSTYNGIRVRVLTPQLLRTVFEQKNEALRSELPLPSLDGNVDLYPYEVSTVFAHGLLWSPRPIFQSYAAYNSPLDAMNASHLEGSIAPEHVFFQVQPIDQRLPALEDAGSWLALLSRYEIAGYNAPRMQLHLRRMDASRPNAVFSGEIARMTASIGSPVQVPSQSGSVWAEIKLAPSFFGDLGLGLLKIPSVQIALTLENGRVVHHRYIPAMGQRGFLLSPYIETTDDFALLCAGIDTGKKVRSFQIETPALWAWQNQFSVRLRQLEIHALPGARRFITIQPSEPPSAIAHLMKNPDSAYQIDLVNDIQLRANERTVSSQDTLKLEGWSVVSGKEGITATEVWIVLTQSDGTRHFYQTLQLPRPDVNLYFRQPNMRDPGFFARLDLAGLHGTQTLDIYQVYDNAAFDCSVDLHVNIISTIDPR